MTRERKPTEQSESDHWSTPPDIVAAALERWEKAGAPIKTDLAANAQNRVVRKFFSARDSALRHDWTKLRGPSWCNPPYSKPHLPSFTAYARTMLAKGCPPLHFLVPASTSEPWFIDTFWRGLDLTQGDMVMRGPLAGWRAHLRGTKYDVELTFLSGRKTFWYGGKPGDSTASKGSVSAVMYPRRGRWADFRLP